MDNVGIVVDDLATTIEFFRELGLELEGQATVEGDWAERVTGLPSMRVEIAMMRTQDGHSRLEIRASWLPEGVTVEQVASGLRPLLDKPVEFVLPTHGKPADRAALERALA